MPRVECVIVRTMRIKHGHAMSRRIQPRTMRLARSTQHSTVQGRQCSGSAGEGKPLAARQFSLGGVDDSWRRSIGYDADLWAQRESRPDESARPLGEATSPTGGS
ncbi:hypothetical protein B7486_02895 [cyanobacterium TDX16]|nr:hypothetical protein B7486_02895 [cyanobacterium TDX16]